MKNILILSCLIQVCIMFNCFTQTKVVRGTTEDISDSIVVRILPENIKKFRSNSILFFSNEKRLKGISKDKFGMLLPFYIYIDGKGKFIDSNTKTLNKKEKKIALDYINAVIKNTSWNLDSSFLTNSIRKRYLLGMNIYIDNNKTLKIGIIPPTKVNTPEYYIWN